MKQLYLAGLFLLISLSIIAQPQIQGPTGNCNSSTARYVYGDGTVYSFPNWSATNGTVTVKYDNSGSYEADVLWDAGATTGTVYFKERQSVIQHLDVILGSGPSTPTGSFTYSSTCNYTTITRTGTPPAGINWYWQTPSDGPSGQNTTFSVSQSINVQGGGAYYLRAKNTTANCWSTGALATATIPYSPTIPTTASYAVCQGGTITLTANAVSGGTLRWYDACVGGTLVQTNSPFTISNFQTSYLYYVSEFNPATGAEGPRQGYQASILTFNTPVPVLPNAVCTGTDITLNATGAGTIEGYHWYSSASSTTLLASLTQTINGPTTFYVSLFRNGYACESNKVAKTVGVSSNTATATVSGNARFGSGPLTLQAGGAATGGSYVWINSSGTTAGQSFNISNINATTTSYVILKTVNADGCQGPPLSVGVFAYPLPVITGQNAVNDGALVLTTDVGYDSYVWKNAANVIVSTSQSFTPTTQESYRVTVTKGGAEGISLPFLALPQIWGPLTPCKYTTTRYGYSDGTVYTFPKWTAINGTIIHEYDNGGSYEVDVLWDGSGTGSVYFRDRNAEITHQNVTPGNGPATPTGSFSYSSNCTYTTITRLDTPPSGITWYWQTTEDGPTGENATFSASQSIDVEGGGTYYLRAKITSSNCWSAGSIATASIPNKPIIPANSINGQITCKGGTSTLIANSSVSGGIIRWYNTCAGGIPVHVNSPFTIDNLQESLLYYVSELNPATGAEGPRQAVQSTVVNLNLPSLVLPNLVCSGTNVTLNAAGAGANEVYKFYSSSSGTPLLQLTQTINSPTTFYVTTTNTIYNCESNKVAGMVGIDENNNLPTVSGNIRFGGGEMTLLAAGTPPDGNYVWSSGNATGSSFYIPNIGSPSSGYVSVQTVNAHGCEGPPFSVNIIIYPLPYITGQNFVAKGMTVTLSTQSGYDSYTWRNGVNSIVSTSQVLETNSPGTYRVTVTKSGIEGTSPDFILGNSLNANLNYVITHSVLDDNVMDENSVVTLPVDKVAQHTTYFDDLGRPLQSVTTQGSPLKKDIVQPIIYDNYGRETIKYLPFISAENNGLYKGDVLSKQATFYEYPPSNVQDDASPYSVIKFEPSPLNRLLKQGAPGVDWQPVDNDPYSQGDHTVKIRDDVNGVNDVIKFTYDQATLTVSPSDHYPAGQLTCRTTIDADQNQVREYKDFQGRVLCKKVQYGSDAGLILFASTYYLYDDIGNLVVVLPPEAVKALTN